MKKIFYGRWIVPISVDFSREGASLIASVLVLASVVGRFGLGFLSSRVDSRMLMAMGIMLQTAGLVFLSAVPLLTGLCFDVLGTTARHGWSWRFSIWRWCL